MEINNIDIDTFNHIIKKTFIWEKYISNQSDYINNNISFVNKILQLFHMFYYHKNYIRKLLKKEIENKSQFIDMVFSYDIEEYLHKKWHYTSYQCLLETCLKINKKYTLEKIEEKVKPFNFNSKTKWIMIYIYEYCKCFIVKEKGRKKDKKIKELEIQIEQLQLEMTYMPGGKGAIEAEKHFLELNNKF
jgi:hypothetical protein